MNCFGRQIQLDETFWRENENCFLIERKYRFGATSDGDHGKKQNGENTTDSFSRKCRIANAAVSEYFV